MPTFIRRVIRHTLAPLLALLAACGGGEENAAPQTPPPIPPSASAPAAPSGISAAAGDASVTLQWNGSQGATGYNVRRATTNGGPYSLIASTGATSHVDASLDNGTTYYYVVTATNAAGESPMPQASAATPMAPVIPPPPPANATVTITVNPGATQTISPYIYGINIANDSGLYPASSGSTVPADLTLDRSGGNRHTAYNWENNYSNAGSDYLYQNDTLMGGPGVAGSAVTTAIASDQARSMASLVTVQMQGLVAADGSGPVSTSNPPDLSRFKKVVFRKSDVSVVPFTLSPPTNDENVFMDEFVWALDQRHSGQGIFGKAPTTRPVFISLDNEPELWNSTHLEIQGPTLVSSDAYISKTIGLATALKSLFPDITLFGPAHYGFHGFYAWQGELAATPSGSNWFVDKYLAAMKTASNNAGRRLIDAYDIHWYSEATDGQGNRVTSLNGTSLNDAQVQAIVQSPRSLWDPTYQENSWVVSALGGPIRLLPRLNAKISNHYPGTRLAITEYHNGGARHIAGTIAQADNLGIFAGQGIFAATFWPLVANEPYALAGFRAYRNFDGAHSHFGDVAVEAVSSDPATAVVHVSKDTSQPGRVVMVAINRSTKPQVVAVSGMPVTGTARLFRMSSATASGQTTVQPVAAGTQAVSGTSLTLELPALSVTTVDIH